MSNTATAMYPEHMKPLLIKAGLIGKGILEVRSVRTKKKAQVATAMEGAEALTFEERDQSLDYDIHRGWTNPIKNNNGQLAGYWANGLSKAERELLHNECGIPYYHLDEGYTNSQGEFVGHRDTVFHVHSGKRYNMSNPVHVAEVRCLFEGTYIGRNKQDAQDWDADFYFFSLEEVKESKRKRNQRRKQAVKLIDELSLNHKREVLRVAHYQGSIMIDPYMSSDDVDIMFDEIVYDKPIAIMNAYEHPHRYEFVVIYSLVSAGAIELGDTDGPFYKSPQHFGSRTMIAETEAQCYKAILAEHDLMAMFNRLEKDNVFEPDAGEVPVDSTLSDLMNRHFDIKAEEEDSDSDVNPLEPIIKKSNRNTLFKMLEDSNIEHTFDENSDIKEIRAFCIKELTNGK